MNINPNFQMLKLPVTVNQKRENNSRAIMANNNGDTFVHSAPSFKGAEQDLLKKHPEFAAMIGAAVGAAVAAFVEKLGLNEPAKNNEEYVYTSTVTDQCEDTYSYYANNTSVNTDKKNSEKTESQQKTEETKTDNRQQDGMVQFVFPKKGCRLKTNETKLRALTENMSMPADYAERLQNVCKKLFGKENYTVEDKVLSATEITTLLYDELVDKKDDLNSVKSIIDKYNSYLEAPVEGVKPNTEENIALETNVTTQENPKGPKIVGKIPKDKLTPESNARDFITRNAKGEIININSTFSIGKDESTEDFVNKIYRKFVHEIYGAYKDNAIEKPKWLTGESLPERVLSRDIKSEIENQTGEHRYKNIVGLDYDELADIINADPRYKQLFTIHSALRFIDRFVCFDDDSDVPSIEEQSKYLLDKLFDLIKPPYLSNSDKNIVPVTIEVYKYEDKDHKYNKDNGKYGYRIILRNVKLNDYNKNAEPRDIAIGFAEKQAGKTYKAVKNENKMGIVSTIFPKDYEYGY